MNRSERRRYERHGSRPGVGPEPSTVPASVGIDVTCRRGGHKPQVWKIRRDTEGPEEGQVWYEKRPDGLSPEQAEADPEHPRLVFGCPSCGHDVVWTLAKAHERFDAVAASGRRVVVYPL